MTKKSVTTLAFAALCLGALAAAPASAQTYTNPPVANPPMVNPPMANPPAAYTGNQFVAPGPQASVGAYGDWSAAANVRASMRYDRLLKTSMGFRRHRMWRECHPITDPQLRQDCIASFAQYEPFAGRRAYYGGGVSPYINPPYSAGE